MPYFAGVGVLSAISTGNEDIGIGISMTCREVWERSFILLSLPHNPTNPLPSGCFRNVVLVRADVARLPFSSGSLGGVHAGAALHCWPSPSLAVSALPPSLYLGTDYEAYERVAQMPFYHFALHRGGIAMHDKGSSLEIASRCRDRFYLFFTKNETCAANKIPKE